MELFATDRDRLAFLMETDAALGLDFEALEAQGRDVSEELPPEKRPKYITNYIGSKQKLVDWIWKHTPEGVSSAADAFSGSAVVAYMFKTKGLGVLVNDRLHYCYHAARAIIENNSTRLSDEDVEALLTDNPKAGSFVRDNFKGIFFAKGVHALIDTIRANVDRLSGFKKDLALFSLGKTCMSGKGGFGHFSSSTRYGKRKDSPEEFKARFRKIAARINVLVFNNSKECKALRKDINDFLPEAKVDLAYFDPPYATEFSTTNYEKTYHFVEGLMTYWKGLNLVEGSKTKHYETDHKTVTRANAAGFFETFLGNAKKRLELAFCQRNYTVLFNCFPSARVRPPPQHVAAVGGRGRTDDRQIGKRMEKMVDGLNMVCGSRKNPEKHGKRPVSGRSPAPIPVSIFFSDREGLSPNSRIAGFESPNRRRRVLRI